MKKFLASVLLLGFAFCGQKETEMVTEITETLSMNEPVELLPIYRLVSSKDGLGEQVGTISVFSIIENGVEGVELEIEASGMTQGAYGFHLHTTNTAHPTTNQDGMEVLGGGLGPHWDPDQVHVHAGPEGHGHKGDLPNIEVAEDGTVDQVITTMNFSISDIDGRAFVIHKHQDNYQNVPENGGSGARVYTAVSPYPAL